MYRYVGNFLYVLVAALLAVACSSNAELRPFASDGCSLFPDASLINQDDWCSCCFEHDIAYWRGGTAVERESVDLKLKECVLEKTRNEALAALMYEGVRFGGSPYFYNWYRWGYGWSYDRKYQALSTKEIAQVEGLLKIYVASGETDVCRE